MSKRSTLTWLTASSVSQMGINSVAALGASLVLGPHGRGLMVIESTVASVAVLIGALGTGPVLRSRFVAASSADTRELTACYTWWSVVATASAVALAIAMSAGSALIIDANLADGPYLLAVGVLACAFATQTQFPDAWYAAELFRAGSLWSAAASLAGTAGLLVATLVVPRAWFLILAQATGILIVGLFQARRLRLAGLLRLRGFRRSGLTSLLRSGSHAFGFTAALAFVLAMDRYLLGAFAGPAAVGLYSVASTLGQLPRLVPQSIGQLVNQSVAARPDTADVGRPTVHAIWAAAIVAVVVTLAGGIVIIGILGPEFREAASLLPMIAVAEIAFAPFFVASRALLGGEFMGTAAAIGAVSATTAGVLLTAGILWDGATGAALARIALCTVMSLLTMKLVRRRFGPRTRSATSAPHQAQESAHHAGA